MIKAIYDKLIGNSILNGENLKVVLLSVRSRCPLLFNIVLEVQSKPAVQGEANAEAMERTMTRARAIAKIFFISFKSLSKIYICK